MARKTTTDGYTISSDAQAILDEYGVDVRDGESATLGQICDRLRAVDATEGDVEQFEHGCEDPKMNHDKRAAELIGESIRDNKISRAPWSEGLARALRSIADEEGGDYWGAPGNGWRVELDEVAS